MAYKENSPIPIVEGGTASTTFAGNKILIQSQPVSGSPSEINFTTGITGYSYFEVDIFNFLQSDSAANLQLRFSKDGGGTWEATNYSYAGLTAGSGGAVTGIGAGGVTLIPSGPALNNTASQYTVNGKIQFWNLTNSGQFKQVTSLITLFTSGSVLQLMPLAGAWAATNVVDGIQFSVSAGTMSQGTFRLFGIV